MSAWFPFLFVPRWSGSKQSLESSSKAPRRASSQADSRSAAQQCCYLRVRLNCATAGIPKPSMHSERCPNHPQTSLFPCTRLLQTSKDKPNSEMYRPCQHTNDPSSMQARDDGPKYRHVAEPPCAADASQMYQVLFHLTILRKKLGRYCSTQWRNHHICGHGIRTTRTVTVGRSSSNALGLAP